MNLKITIVLALMFLLLACENEEVQHVFDLTIENEFKIDQMYYSPDQLIEFSVDDINDSRCPEGVTCIWQGEARVHLLFEKPFVENIELSTYNKLKDTISNYEIQLIDVQPYPEIGKEVKLNEYSVTLRFVEL